MNIRCRFITTILFAVLSFPSLISAQEETETDSQSIYGRAVAAWNSGKIPEAKAILDKLLADYPDFYKAYPLYWDVLGRTDEAEARKAAAEGNLGQFEKVPADERTEDYYDAAIKGYEILNKTERVEALKKEAIAKFPRSLTAQSARLDSARQQKDPVKAAAIYQSFLDDFDDNHSWTWIAAQNRFELIAQNPDLFDANSMQEAAAQLDRLTQRHIDTYGDPYRYVHTMYNIARAFQDIDASTSLSFAQKGLDFIQKTWSEIDAPNKHQHIIFWPVMLRANIALKNWTAACRIGEDFVQEIDSGSLPEPLLADLEVDRARRDYAIALEQIDAIEQAREQLALAALLNEDFEKEYDSFSSRHPLNPEEIARFNASLSAKRSRAHHSREEQIRKKLMATEIHKPAVDFKLKDLGGNYVELADFGGKTLILAFWATWCGPCHPELEELKIAYEKYQNDPHVSIATINIDEDKSLVAPFAEENKYNFPILLTDGTIEEPYQATSLPKLYIIDATGHIRFIIDGYIKDNFFLKKLDWMVAAVLE